MALTEVVLPQIAVSTLAGHVKRCEGKRFCVEPFHVEAHCRCDVMVFGIAGLEIVDYGSFAGIIQTNNQDTDFPLFHSKPLCQCVEETHAANFWIR